MSRITVSVAAATAHTYAQVRRSPKFERVGQNTQRLIAERDRLGAPVGLDFPPCHHLWDYTVVCWDGRIGICCIDGCRFYIVGDANTQTMAEVYNGPKIETIREVHRQHRTDKLPICVDCSFRDQSHIGFSANVHRTGAMPGPFLPVPTLPILA